MLRKVLAERIERENISEEYYLAKTYPVRQPENCCTIVKAVTNAGRMVANRLTAGTTNAESSTYKETDEVLHLCVML